jgi:two-component system, NtrC family, sensor kinase
LGYGFVLPEPATRSLLALLFPEQCALMSFRPRLSALSLRSIILLGMAVGILLPAAVLGVVLALEWRRTEFESRVFATLQQYGTMLSQSLPGALWLADKSAAAPFVSALMLNPDLVRVVVDDELLGVFLSQERPAPPGGDIVSASWPVRKDDKTIGRVTVYVSTAMVEAKFQAGLIQTGLGLLAQLSISFLLLWMLFERRLMRPLHQLRRDANRLASGEMRAPVTVLHADEMGELAISLDQMRLRLSEHIVKVQELNAHLEQRVDERTQASHEANRDIMDAMETLKSAQGEIQRSERLAALGALVAGVSHELNTPIGICVTVASTLHDLSEQFSLTLKGDLTRAALSGFVDNTRQASDLLVRNLASAAELISSFKQVAVDRTSAQRRPFLLDDMLNELLTTMGPQLKRFGHQVQLDIPPAITLLSYPGALGQIVSNLVHNALLHAFESSAGGLITISAQALADERIVLTVSDNGVGIPDAHIGRIFDPFFTTKMGRGGTGLGLNIVHNLTTNVLGGHVRVSSVCRQSQSLAPLLAPLAQSGTRFELTLPCTAPETPQSDELTAL